MQKHSIFIFDPEGSLEQQILTALYPDPNFCIVGCCSSIAEAMSIDEFLLSQILIVNIDFCCSDDVFALLNRNQTAAVVFISQCDSFSLPLFEHFTVAYLIKVFSILKLKNTLHKYLRFKSAFSKEPVVCTHTVDFPKRILVQHGKHHKCISTREITHLQADRDNTRIYTINNKQYITNLGIGIVSKKLDPSMFIRIHRSYIVNIEHVTGGYKDISRLFISLPNYIDISVGKKYHSAIRNIML